MSSLSIRDTIKGSIAIGKGEQGIQGVKGDKGDKGDNNDCIGLSPTSEAEIWFDTNDGISGEEIATKKFVEATNEELISRLDNLIISNGDGNKDSELIDARNGETTLGNKIRKIDESLDNNTNLINAIAMIPIKLPIENDYTQAIQRVIDLNRPVYITHDMQVSNTINLKANSKIIGSGRSGAKLTNTSDSVLFYYTSLEQENDYDLSIGLTFEDYNPTLYFSGNFNGN